MAYSSLNSLLNASEEFFVVTLADDHELHLLMRLLDIDLSSPILLSPSGDFVSLFDYSEKSLPVFSLEGFDTFYEEWLSLSKRESNMDEYGQLIFLQGHAASWNKKSSRFIFREKP